MILPLVFLAWLALVTSDYLSEFSSESWKQLSQAPSHHNLCFYLALSHTSSQRSALDAKLKAVSDPYSPDYGEHLSLSQIRELIGKDPDTLEQIEAWVRNHNPTHYKCAASNDICKLCLGANEAINLFGTSFHHFSHSGAKRTPVRATTLASIPKHLLQHISFVGNLNTPIHNYEVTHPRLKGTSFDSSEVDAEIEKEDTASHQSRHLLQVRSEEPVLVKAPEIVSLGTMSKQIRIRFRAYCQNGTYNEDVKFPCYSNPPLVIGFRVIVVIPTQLMADIEMLVHPPVQCDKDAGLGFTCLIFVNVPMNYVRYQVKISAEYADGSASAFSSLSRPIIPCDFATAAFLKDLYGIPQNLRCSHPSSSQAVVEFEDQYYSHDDLHKFFRIQGIADQEVYKTVGFNNETLGALKGRESTLDIQYIMAVAADAKTWFWSMGSEKDTTTNDEPFLKWLYQIADTEDAPLVHSVSYDDKEEIFPQWYSDRVNVEFQKMGLRGMTILVSAGDDGCHGEGARKNKTECLSTHPSFPASSPYVLAVGATQLTYNGAPICSMNVSGIPVGCNLLAEQGASADNGAVVTSGGGFSNYYSRPHWQDNAVKNYLSSPHVNLPQAPNFFNRDGRGYPDISVFSNLFLLVMNQEVTALSGSSASAPLMSAIVTLWNDVRFNVGLKPIGFANPLLYEIHRKFPWAFKDGLTGSNRCTVQGQNCCDEGFEASMGWDPFTGLGAPKFNEILRIMLAMGANRTQTRPGHELNAYLASLGLSLSLVLPPDVSSASPPQPFANMDLDTIQQRQRVLRSYTPLGFYLAACALPVLLLLVAIFSRCRTFTSILTRQRYPVYQTFHDFHSS